MSRPFSIDFHVHTAHSFDSLTPPKVAIELARRRGLDGIAVTDHDTISGAIATVEANRYGDFLVIPGIEVKTDLGDVIALYAKRDVKSRAFSDVIAEIHDQGALAYLPHPVRTFGKCAAEIHEGFPAIDLWEKYNGRYGSKDFATADGLFEQCGIDAALCGSDAHWPWEIGLFATLLERRPNDASDLRDLAIAGHLNASPRPELALRTGIALGETTKALKGRQYATVGRLILSLPWKAARRAMSLHRGAG